eukprot:Nitzschia sp. Nitz4//scaffold2_size372955//170467//171643//NITZ4_000420-RA/size372955-snap-gene-0.80-mRNA-1//-1//CDS//3329546769//5676//frame0
MSSTLNHTHGHLPDITSMSNKNHSDSTLLPACFQPTDEDIICGRARENYHHGGNKNFRDLIQNNVGPYIAAKTKLEKSEAIAEIVDKVRRRRPLGGFIKRDPSSGRWFQIKESEARDKVGHAIRKAVQRLEDTKPKLAARLKKEYSEKRTKSVETNDQQEINTEDNSSEHASLHSGIVPMEAPSSSEPRASAIPQGYETHSVNVSPRSPIAGVARGPNGLASLGFHEKLVVNPVARTATDMSSVSLALQHSPKAEVPLLSLAGIDPARLIAGELLARAGKRPQPSSIPYDRSTEASALAVDKMLLSAAIRERELKRAQELIYAQNLALTGIPALSQPVHVAPATTLAQLLQSQTSLADLRARNNFL